MTQTAKAGCRVKSEGSRPEWPGCVGRRHGPDLTAQWTERRPLSRGSREGKAFEVQNLAVEPLECEWLKWWKEGVMAERQAGARASGALGATHGLGFIDLWQEAWGAQCLCTQNAELRKQPTCGLHGIIPHLCPNDCVLNWKRTQ